MSGRVAQAFSPVRGGDIAPPVPAGALIVGALLLQILVLYPWRRWANSLNPLKEWFAQSPDCFADAPGAALFAPPRVVGILDKSRTACEDCSSGDNT